MALVASTIANNGVEMKPKLVDELRAQSGAVTTLGPQVLANVLPSDRATLISGRWCTCGGEGQYGASFAGGARVPRVTVAGKRRLAQLGDGSLLPHSWFIGFAPADNPQIAIAVIVERAAPARPGRSDGRSAAGGYLASARPINFGTVGLEKSLWDRNRIYRPGDSIWHVARLGGPVEDDGGIVSGETHGSRADPGSGTGRCERER